MALFCYSCNFSVLLHKVANFIVIKPQKQNFNNILPDIRQFLTEYPAFKAGYPVKPIPDIRYPAMISSRISGYPALLYFLDIRLSGQITIRYIPRGNIPSGNWLLWKCLQPMNEIRHTYTIRLSF